MEKPKLTRDQVKTVYDSRYIKVYGMEFTEGHPYMNASRRTPEELVALKSDEEFKTMLPDAVSCFVIFDGEEPKLLMTYEFRYPTGQFLLSPPAGLIDAADKCKASEEAMIATAIRELKEETNIDYDEKADRIEIISPLLFSTPGMTDESNGLVGIILSDAIPRTMNQDGAEGTECFDGFALLTKADAGRILKQGRDDQGNFFSIFTWAGLMYFVSDMWRL